MRVIRAAGHAANGLKGSESSASLGHKKLGTLASPTPREFDDDRL
jgi:hypothetical protein